MRDLNARLQKLEIAIRPLPHRTVRHFAIEGPKEFPDEAAAVFLRECGYKLRDEDLNIIRIMVAPGRDLPLRDITAECYR